MINHSRTGISEKIYLAGLLLLAVALPFSNFLMSVSQILLIAAWIIGGSYSEKLNRFIRSKPALIFACFYLLHLIGMLYTADAKGGVNDLRVKLPLLILPFVIAGMPDVSAKHLRSIFWLFVAAVFAETVLLSVKPEFTGAFVSPIRLSMMASFSVFVTLYLGFSQQVQWLRVAASVLICWLVIFLVKFPYDTGIITFVCALFYFVFIKIIRAEQLWMKGAFIAGIFLLAASGYIFIQTGINDFFKNSAAVIPAQDEYTALGEKYTHQPERKDLENGNYVWRYIARRELELAWNKRSVLHFDWADAKGNPLDATIIRFLTSKGLKKDAAGVNQLSDAEIRAIEQGTANVRFMDGMTLSNRLYETIWSFHQYEIGHTIQKNSILQRLEYWKAGRQVFLEAPVFGHGTGSVLSLLKRQYENTSALESGYRLKSHNQYLSTAIALGAVGVAVLLLCFLVPVFIDRGWQDELLIVFLIIALAAMLVEDTLETQAGITFILFFIALLLFQSQRKAAFSTE